MLLIHQLSSVSAYAPQLLLTSYWVGGETLFRHQSTEARSVTTRARLANVGRILGVPIAVHAVARVLGSRGVIAHEKPVVILSIAGAVCAFALRGWAMKVLGKFFTRDLKVQTSQRVITRGPYKLLRHPGYSANLIMYTSYAALATKNAYACAFSALLFITLWHFRINAEEKMLEEAFGNEYRDYRKGTYRMIPLLY